MTSRTYWRELARRPRGFSTRCAILASVSFLISVGLLPDRANAIGEIFQLKTRGIEYCGPFDFERLTPKTSLPLWLRVDSDTQLTISVTSNFADGCTFPLDGVFYQTKATKAAFVGGALFLDGSYVTAKELRTSTRTQV